MTSSIYKYYWLFVGSIYKKILNEKMSVEVTDFLKNISYVGFGTFIATAFSLAFNILVGRLLGPAEYGQFSLVQSIAMFLYIPMLMGYSNAMIKYNAEEDNFNRQKCLISTTYILVFISTILSVCVYLLIPQKVLDYFSVSYELFHLSIIFAILYVVYTITTNTLRGLYKIKKYSIFTPIYSVSLFISFSFFIYINSTTYKSALFSIFFAEILSSVIILILIHECFIYKFDKLLAYRLTNYGLYTIIGGLAFVFYSNIDQIVINMYMNTEDLGLYKAYYFASINVANVLFTIFNSVFFPVASKHKDKKIILGRISKFTPYLVGCGIPFMVVSELIILYLYGRAYTITLLLVISFAIVSILIVYYGIYSWTFNSEGIKGVKLVNKSTIIIAIVNIVLDICLIPFLGLLGATVSTGTAFLIGIYFLLKMKKTYEL